MGNCLLGAKRRTEKAAKLAESKVAEYQVRYDATHATWENAVRVRAQAVAALPKGATKEQRAAFVQNDKGPVAVRVRDAHAKVQRTERELGTAKHLLNVARKALQMAQSSAVAHETKKMVHEFNQLLPQDANLDSLTKDLDKFEETDEAMKDLDSEMENAFQGLADNGVDEENADWLMGDQAVVGYSDDDDQIAELAPDRKVAEETHAPSAPRSVARTPVQRLELLE